MADTVPLSQASRGGFRGDPGWLSHTGWQDQNKCVGWLLSGTNSMTLVVGKSRTNEQPLLQPWTSCHWGFGHAVEHMRKEQLARDCRGSI